LSQVVYHYLLLLLINGHMT